MVATAYVHIEAVRDTRHYALVVPMGASYKEAEEVCLELLGGLKDLASRASQTEQEAPPVEQAPEQAA